MRSLSNLYKSQYVINNQNNQRIINSNDKVDEYMQDYIRMKREEELAEGGFVEGLNAEEVEVVDEETAEEIPAEEMISEEEQAEDML